MSTFIPNRFCILIANFVTTDVFTTYEPSVELSFRKLTDHEHCLMSIILQCVGKYSKKVQFGEAALFISKAKINIL